MKCTHPDTSTMTAAMMASAAPEGGVCTHLRDLPLLRSGLQYHFRPIGGPVIVCVRAGGTIEHHVYLYDLEPERYPWGAVNVLCAGPPTPMKPSDSWTDAALRSARGSSQSPFIKHLHYHHSTKPWCEVPPEKWCSASLDTHSQTTSTMKTVITFADLERAGWTYLGFFRWRREGRGIIRVGALGPACVAATLTHAGRRPLVRGRAVRDERPEQPVIEDALTELAAKTFPDGQSVRNWILLP